LIFEGDNDVFFDNTRKETAILRNI
jgi:hypothetical protein